MSRWVRRSLTDSERRNASWRRPFMSLRSTILGFAIAVAAYAAFVWTLRTIPNHVPHGTEFVGLSGLVVALVLPVVNASILIARWIRRMRQRPAYRFANHRIRFVVRDQRIWFKAADVAAALSLREATMRASHLNANQFAYRWPIGAALTADGVVLVARQAQGPRGHRIVRWALRIGSKPARPGAEIKNVNNNRLSIT